MTTKAEPGAEAVARQAELRRRILNLLPNIEADGHLTIARLLKEYFDHCDTCGGCGYLEAPRSDAMLACPECEDRKAIASIPQDKRIAVLAEALAVAIAGLGRVNVLCFDRETSPLKPVGDAARIALADICGLLGDERYDEIARAALNGGSNDQG